MFRNFSPRLSLASLPVLPCLYLLFEFTVIHGNGRVAKNGEGLGDIHHVSEHKVNVGGRS